MAALLALSFPRSKGGTLSPGLEPSSEGAGDAAHGLLEGCFWSPNHSLMLSCPSCAGAAFLQPETATESHNFYRCALTAILVGNRKPQGVPRWSAGCREVLCQGQAVSFWGWMGPTGNLAGWDVLLSFSIPECSLGTHLPPFAFRED